MGKVVKAVVGVAAAVVGVVTGQWWLVAAGAALAVSSAIKMPKVTANAATDQRLSKKLEPEAFRKIVFGKTASGEDLRYWEVYGSEANEYDEVIAAATHRINKFCELYFAEELAVATGATQGTGKFGWPNGGGVVRNTSLEGISGQVITTVGRGTLYRSTSSMTGCAHFRLRFVYKQEKWPQGLPSRYTQVIEGAPVYDPRRDIQFGGTHKINDQSTWQYDVPDGNGEPIGRNNALQMLWYQIGWRIAGKLVAGKGVDYDDLDLASFIQAANDCEVMRWYSDCILSTGDSHDQNEGILCAAAGALLLDTGGRYSYHPAVDDTANIAVNLDHHDIISDGFNWTPRDPLSEFFNEVAGTFIDPASLYQSRPLPLVYDNAYYNEDGRKVRASVGFAAVQDADQGQRLNRIKLNKSRLQGEFTATFTYKAMRAQNWSNVTLTLPEMGWTNKLFRVVSFGLSAMNGIDLTLREESASFYQNGTVVQLPAPSLGIADDPYFKIPVVGLDSIVTGVSGDGGTAVDAVQLLYGMPHPLTDHTEITYRKVGTTAYATASSTKDLNNPVIQPLQPLTTYEFNVRHVSIYGVPGDWFTEIRTTNAVTRNSAGQLVYADGTTVEALKPAGPNANNTQTNTAAAIFGQGPGATASPEAVLNKHVPYGVNSVVNSGMEKGQFGFSEGWNGPNGLNIVRRFGVAGQVRFADAFNATGATNTAGPFDIFSTCPTYGNVEDLRRFALPVVDGDRVYGSALAAYAGGAEGVHLFVAFFNGAGGSVNDTTLQQGGRFNVYPEDGNPASFDRIGGFTDVPVGARFAVLYARVMFPANSGSDGHSYAAQPMLCRVPPGYVAHPPYNAGPVDPRSDATALNISAGFSGQGALATQSQADWASQVTGLGRPENYATNSRVYTQFDQPAAPSVNDVWVRLNASGQTIATLAWNGSAWVVGADITGWNVAAGFAGQNWGATASQEDANNRYVRYGQNVLVNSDGRNDGYAWGFTNGGGITSGLNLHPSYSGQRNVFTATFAGLPPAEYYDVFGTKGYWAGWGTMADTRVFGLPVFPGDRLAASAGLGTHRCAVEMIAIYFSDNGTLLEGIGSGLVIGRDGGGLNGDPANFDRVSFFADVSHPEARWAQVFFRIRPRAGGWGENPYIFMTEPLLARIQPNQQVQPVYTPGPADPVANRTQTNISSGFQGQGALATQSAVTWASQVTGAGKPADDATKSRVFTQQAAPTGQNVNDIWVKLNGSNQAVSVAAWNGSQWVDGGNVTSFFTAAGIAGQGWGATASEQQASNAKLPLGVNRVVNSELSGPTGILGTFPKGWGTAWGGNGSRGPDGFITANSSGRNSILAFYDAAFSPGNGTVFDVGGNIPNSEPQRKRYGVPVKPFDRVAFSARVAKFRAAETFMGIAFYRADGSYITEYDGSRYSGADINGNVTHPSYFALSSGIVTAPAESAYAAVWQRVVTNGLTGPHGWFAEPMIAVVAADQTAVPAYNPGPTDYAVDKTSENVASGFLGQGWGATANQDQVGNDRVKVGVNTVVDSDMIRGWAAFGAGWNGPVTNSPYRNIEGTTIRFVRGAFAPLIAEASVFDLFTSNPRADLGITAVREYGLSVRQGDRLFASCLAARAAGAGVSGISLQIGYYNGNGDYIGEETAAYGGRDGYVSAVGDPNEFDRIGGFVEVSNANARWAVMWARVNKIATPDPRDGHSAAAQPMLCKVGPGQTVWPDYQAGPSGKRADPTADNIAGGIVGQGPVATQPFPTYAGMAAAIAAGLTNGQQFLDSSNGNKLTAVVISTGGGLKASVNTGYISGNRTGAGNVQTTSNVVVTVDGGNAGASIRWLLRSGDSRINMNNPTSFNTGAYMYIGVGEVVNGYMEGIITKGGESTSVFVDIGFAENT